jgi:glutamate carboxypeptidase
MLLESTPSTSAFAEALSHLVSVESPSEDHEAVRRAQVTLAEVGESLLGEPPSWTEPDDGPAALTWHRGRPEDPARVLVLGHVDTVWPCGTTRTRPFDVRNGRAYGPGVFDMKAGLVVGLFALRETDPELPVSLMVTGDEEIGSWTSRELILEEAARTQAVLVLEGAGPDGALKSARKGWSVYKLHLRGVAAHAGLEPHKGRNALIRLASLIGELTALDGQVAGRTVTPTTASAGTTVNTVPAMAELSVDVRTRDLADQQEINCRIGALAGTDRSGVEVEVSGGVNRPPMEREAALPLLDRLSRLATANAPLLPDIAVGGISDANLTAAAGVPTLDGLGAVGGGAHADDEWVDLEATQRRIPLVADLIRDLVREPLDASRRQAELTRRQQ